MSLISRVPIIVSARKRAEAQFAALQKSCIVGFPDKAANSAALAGKAASRAALVRRGLRGLVPHTLSLRPGS